MTIALPFYVLPSQALLISDECAVVKFGKKDNALNALKNMSQQIPCLKQSLGSFTNLFGSLLCIISVCLASHTEL